jgi:F-type H+-transporting ATPase subunit delta
MARASASMDAIAARYAGAIFDLAIHAQATDAVAQVFAALAGVMRADVSIQRACAHPLTSRETKAAMLLAAIPSAHPLAKQAVEVIAHQGRSAVIPEISAALQQRLSAARGEIHVSVLTASALSASAKSELETALHKATGKTPVMDTKTDAALIGGVRVQIGGKLLDATLATSLETMRKQLLAVNG